MISNILHPTLLKDKATTLWNSLPTSSSALAIASMYDNNKQPLLIIVPDASHATKLMNNLKYFSENRDDIFLFPDRETLPYDQISPHKDIISERINLLYKLIVKENYVLIISVNTICQKLPPNTYVKNNTFFLSNKDQINLSTFRLNLEHLGYNHTSQVISHCEYSIRGGIIDIFPMGSKYPFRIELFDDEIESLRIFDPDSQTSIKTIDKIEIMPAHETPLEEESTLLFKSQWKEMFDLDPKKCPIFQAINQKKYVAGLEYYLPLFFDKTHTIFDYIKTNTTIVGYQDIFKSAEKYNAEFHERYEQLSVDKYRSLLSPELLTITSSKLNNLINQYPNITITNSKHLDGCDFKCSEIPSIDQNSRYKKIKETKVKTLIVSETLGRREILTSLLKEYDINPVAINNWHDFISLEKGIYIGVSPILEGFSCNENKFTLISENDILGYYQAKTAKPRTKQLDPATLLKNFNELELNSPIVHLRYGVGLYKGLKTIETKHITSEFICIEYANSDMIYVPITSLNLISRYTGKNADHVKLTNLGTNQWKKIKKEALIQIHDVAVELLELYAKRSKLTKPPFTLQHDHYNKFCAKFAYEETPDQLTAISEVIKDITSKKLMDRLICGDVGFGKTEIAMRAAFIAAKNNRQTAILVPTTILAQQHFESFINRFAGFEVKIACLSRFKSSTEKKAILHDLHKGKIDIIIGTHALLQKSIQYLDLGLLVIDEEHRFGVKHKEHIKSLKTKIDVLTLTATPIPRTLDMSLSGIKDISIIATPPERRLAIKTSLNEKKDYIIREAILREFMRGGQIYYLHNNVQTIELAKKHLEKLVPEASIKIAHGQLSKHELEQVMFDFYHNKFNLLLCTTIIESGLDVPTANTIIIERADRFGLAQLHQLRGRVGRSHHQAYAYLMIPNKKIITRDAIKRLDALSSLEDLGAGFVLATHDLEIRGSGEVLGLEQSGKTQNIGFTLFTELLEKAVKALKNNKVFDENSLMESKCEINLNISSIIPENYISNIQQRLIVYKRIANANSQEELDELQIELIDRFGLIPQDTKNLFEISHYKLIAEKYGIVKIEINEKRGFVAFSKNPNVDVTKLIELVNTNPNKYSFSNQNKLVFNHKISDNKEKLLFVKNLLSFLKTNVVKTI